MEKFTSIREIENHALNILEPCVKEYYLYSQENMSKVNQDAFRKLRIRPRMLRNVSAIDISTKILGETISLPVGVSPTATQKYAHPDGECANAKAAEAANTVFILSSFSTSTIEEVAKAAPKAIKWLQLSLLKDTDFILYIIRKAEHYGFKALVVTIDNPVYPKSKVNGANKLMSYNYAIFKDYYKNKTLQEFQEFFVTSLDNSLTWKDISWLKSQTKLPIVVKGVMTAEDALLCTKHGAGAVLVSNHGGRTLHGIPATIEILPEIVKAVKGTIEIYLDGGVREGLDVFKALALGANMVFMGRPFLWGLACGGEDGARRVLETMRDEIINVFALAGCSSIEKVTKDLIIHESMYHKL